MSLAPIKAKGVDTNAKPGGAQVPTWLFKAVPDDTRANRMSNQAVAMLKNGDARGALQLLEQAAKLPGEKGTDAAALQNRIGVAWNRLGEHDKALAAFDKAGEKYPPALYNKAVSTLKAAIAESGQWEAFTANKGSVSLELLDPKELDKAVDLLGKAVGSNRELFSKMAREDGDWAPLLESPKFRALAGLEPLKKGQTVTGASGASGYAAGQAVAPPKREEEQKAYVKAQRGLGFETS